MTAEYPEGAERSGASTASDFAEQCGTPRGPRWKRVLERIGIGIGVTVVVLVVLGVSLYEWGGMSGSVDPTMPARYDALVAQGKAQPIQARFVIPIPGCTCHSTDPVQTAKHRTYRISECGRCHNGKETAQDVPAQ
jgi:hypothetical protein